MHAPAFLAKIKSILLRLLAPVAVTAMIVAPLAIAAPASATSYYYLHDGSGNYVVDEGHNNQVQLWYSDEDSFFERINAQRWTDPDGAIVTVYEYEDPATGLCMNDPDNGNYAVYMDSCSAGDANELWYSASDHAFANAGQSNRGGCYPSTCAENWQVMQTFVDGACPEHVDGGTAFVGSVQYQPCDWEWTLQGA